MKSVKVFSLIATLIAALMVIVVFASCGSSAKSESERVIVSTGKTEVIEHKGTVFGINKYPPWLDKYLNGNGTRAIERLDDYKEVYVFIAEEQGAELQYVETWAKNFNAQQQIGAFVKTRVESLFKANDNKNPNDASKRKYDNWINTLVSATYTGARQEADWWLHTRTTVKGKEPEIRYTSYVLYTIQKKVLDQQIKNQIIKIKDSENRELNQFFDAVAAQLIERGLEWEEE
jgi:hypothetical protein